MPDIKEKYSEQLHLLNEAGLGEEKISQVLEYLATNYDGMSDEAREAASSFIAMESRSPHIAKRLETFGNQKLYESSFFHVDGNRALSPHSQRVIDRLRDGQSVNPGLLQSVLSEVGSRQFAERSSAIQSERDAKLVAMESSPEQKEMVQKLRNAARVIRPSLSTDGLRTSVTTDIDDAIADGDFQHARAVLQGYVESSLSSEEATRFRARLNMAASMRQAGVLLRRYKEAGGDLNIFSGKIEGVLNALGTTRDPRLAEIETDLKVQLQTYRQSVSGAAFSVPESKEYARIIPSKNNTIELSEALIAGFATSIERNNRIAMRKKLDSDILDLVTPRINEFGETAEEEASRTGAGSPGADINLSPRDLHRLVASDGRGFLAGRQVELSPDQLQQLSGIVNRGAAVRAAQGNGPAERVYGEAAPLISQILGGTSPAAGGTPASPASPVDPVIPPPPIPGQPGATPVAPVAGGLTGPGIAPAMVDPAAPVVLDDSASLDLLDGDEDESVENQ